MRMMLRFTIPVEKGNSTAADGSLTAAIESLVSRCDSSRAYFHLEDGKRAGTVIFHADDQAQMAVINEPFFAAVNAEISIQPVMTLEDITRNQ